jgi:hypothetical protein
MRAQSPADSGRCVQQVVVSARNATNTVAALQAMLLTGPSFTEASLLLLHASSHRFTL